MADQVTPKTKKCSTCPTIVPKHGGTPTRASCVDCAEKHLGAAMVLLAEVRDGYSHRILAIGHLFQAEDETQAWVELHAAIRNARIAYQSAGAMPDWEMLAELCQRAGRGELTLAVRR